MSQPLDAFTLPTTQSILPLRGLCPVAVPLRQQPSPAAVIFRLAKSACRTRFAIFHTRQALFTISVLVPTQTTMRLNVLGHAVRRDSLTFCFTFQRNADVRHLDNQMGGSEKQIVYNSQTQLWNCCSTKADGTIDCSNPADGSVSLPPPRQLRAIYTVSGISAQDPSTTFSTLLSSVSVHTLLAAYVTSSASTFPVISSSSSFGAAIIATASPSSSAASDSGGYGLTEMNKITIGLTVTLVLLALLAIPSLYYAYQSYAASRKKRKNRHARRRGENINPTQGWQDTRRSSIWAIISINWCRQQEEEPVAPGLGIIF